MIDLLKLMHSDFKRYLYIYRRDKLSLLNIFYRIIFEYGFYASIVYRVGNSIERNLKKTCLSPLYILAIAVYQCFNIAVIVLFGIEIDRRAAIGRGLFIGHFGGIRIGPCHMGNYCSVYQQVQIGKTSNRDVNAVPHIGNNVWIGGHSTINNQAVIEDNVTVVVGSVVSATLPMGALVMGNPARVISKTFDQTSLLIIPKEGFN